jgi:hypothetical protein
MVRMNVQGMRMNVHAGWELLFTVMRISVHIYENTHTLKEI